MQFLSVALEYADGKSLRLLTGHKSRIDVGHAVGRSVYISSIFMARANGRPLSRQAEVEYAVERYE
jgi:hypothetical protein